MAWFWWLCVNTRRGEVGKWRRRGGWALATSGNPRRRLLNLKRTHQGQDHTFTFSRSRLVWCAGNGVSYFDPALRGYDVHHRNEDHGDDRLANLELIHASEHRSMPHQNYGKDAGSPEPPPEAAPGLWTC